MTVTLLGVRAGRLGQRPLAPTKARSSAVDRLRVILGLGVKEFERRFPRRDNVRDRDYARTLLVRLRGTVYVLGLEAWALLGLPRRQFFERVAAPGVTFTLLPHPSGRNLMYNDPEVRKRVRRLLCHKRSRSKSTRHTSSSRAGTESPGRTT